RKPSLGPLPLVQTRQGKPLISTVLVFGSDTDLLRGGELRAERGNGRALVLRHWLWPPLVFPVAEQVLDLGHHLLGEQARVVLGDVLAHVAVLQEQHEVADIEAGPDMADLLDHLVGRANQNRTAIDGVPRCWWPSAR